MNVQRRNLLKWMCPHCRKMMPRKVDSMLYVVSLDSCPFCCKNFKSPERVIIRDKGKAHCPHCDNDIHGMGKVENCPFCMGQIIWFSGKEMKRL